MANEEAHTVAAHMIVRRGSDAYRAALDHAERLNLCGHTQLASFWKDIASEVAIIEARSRRTGQAI